MANYCTTDYVFSLDDDLCMNDEKVIQDCIEYAEQHQASIGYTGVILDSEQDYWSSTHILRPKRSRDVEVDIIK